MTEPENRPTLDDVDIPTEQTHPDRREHAKTPHPLNDDELEQRARSERDQTGAGGPLEGR